MTIFSKVVKLAPIKKYKKNTLFVIPFFFTFANAVLGLLSVIKALDCEFVAAAYCILLATFMDSIDGKIARALGSTSMIGMELDSLCDAISFCLAPAILVYSCPALDFGLFGFIIISIYFCAGLFRLAKFNTISSKISSKWFLGLPTPVPAFLLACLIMHEQWLELSFFKFIFKKYAFFLLLLFISYLMISKIRFPAIKKNNGKFLCLQIALFVAMLIALFFKSPYIIFLPIIYMVYGIFNFVLSVNNESES